jgi:heme/copper-type cytochrome/quinol oxidase subunit 3
MKPVRSAADVSALPTVTFGPRSLMWWGTMGFATIEGWTTALLVGAYFYLRQNYEAWPPLRTPDPSLLMPSINLAVMLASTIPATLAMHAAKRLDRAGVRIWLLVSSFSAVVIIVLRWWDLRALNVRWDTNAYGSAVWTIVGFHASLLVLDAMDTIGLTLFFWFRRLPAKSYSDVSDNTFYWYFTIGLWVVLYLVLYVGPRVY